MPLIATPAQVIIAASELKVSLLVDFDWDQMGNVYRSLANAGLCDFDTFEFTDKGRAALEAAQAGA